MKLLTYLFSLLVSHIPQTSVEIPLLPENKKEIKEHPEGFIAIHKKSIDDLILSGDQFLLGTSKDKHLLENPESNAIKRYELAENLLLNLFDGYSDVNADYIVSRYFTLAQRYRELKRFENIPNIIAFLEEIPNIYRAELKSFNEPLITYYIDLLKVQCFNDLGNHDQSIELLNTNTSADIYQIFEQARAFFGRYLTSNSDNDLKFALDSLQMAKEIDIDTLKNDPFLNTNINFLERQLSKYK